MVHGRCDNPEPVNPCDQTKCGEHASCQLTTTDCDFEAGMCGWANGQGDDVQWQLGSAGTPSKGTGPARDHTLLPASCDDGETTTRDCKDDAGSDDAPSGAGQYVYVEASGARAGDEAYLISPEFNTTRDGYDCRLMFYYHMYGADVGYLAVDVKRDPENIASNYEEVWRRSAPPSPAEARHDKWLPASVFIRPDSAFDSSAVQVRLRVGVKGPASDIAIDDIRLVCMDDFVGDCACDPGYIDQSGDAAPGSVCVPDPNEFPPSTVAPPTPVDKCAEGSSLAERFVCENLANFVRVVCGNDGVDYKNPYCATCNNVDTFRVGSCTKPAPPTPVVATCPPNAPPQHLLGRTAEVIEVQ